MSIKIPFIVLRQIISLSMGMITGQILLLIDPKMDIVKFLLITFTVGFFSLMICDYIALWMYNGVGVTSTILKCDLRKKKGSNYCVECEKSFECARGDMNIKIKKEGE